MAQEIVVDQEKGILRMIHRDLVLTHDLWGSSLKMGEQLEKTRTSKVLMDFRGATLNMEDWEKREFAEAHEHIISKKLKFAVLIQENDPCYQEHQAFKVFFTKLGGIIEIFNNEYEAESWLAG